MTDQDPPASNGSSSPQPGSRFWLTDGRGFWRDEVLKDFVKYAVQVGAGLYVAIVLRLIPSGDARTRIAVVIAALLFIVAGVYASVALWSKTSRSSLVWVSAGTLVLGTVLVARADVDLGWIYVVMLAMGVLVTVNAILSTSVDAIRSRKERGWWWSLTTIVGAVMLMAAGGGLITWVLVLLD